MFNRAEAEIETNATIYNKHGIIVFNTAFIRQLECDFCVYPPYMFTKVDMQDEVLYLNLSKTRIGCKINPNSKRITLGDNLANFKVPDGKFRLVKVSKICYYIDFKQPIKKYDNKVNKYKPMKSNKTNYAKFWIDTNPKG